MPPAKLNNGKYGEIAFALDAKTRKMIEDAVMAEYKKVLARRYGSRRFDFGQLARER